MKFKEYLLRLLPRPFRILWESGQEPDIWKWFAATGDLLDEAKQAVLLVRRMWLIRTATGVALDLHGEDRDMPRYPGEGDEEYRQRLMAARYIYVLGGTDPGILLALEKIGYPNSEIYPLYKETKRYFEAGGVALNGDYSLDGSWGMTVPPGIRQDWVGRWAEFVVRLNIGDRTFLPTDHAILLDTIRRTKASHARLAEITMGLASTIYAQHYLRSGIRIKAPVIGSLGMVVSKGVVLNGATPQAQIQKNHLDGRWKLGGQITLVGRTVLGGWRLDHRRAKAAAAVTVAKQLSNPTVAERAWFLNGGGHRYFLDGKTPLTSNPLNGYHRLDGSWHLVARSLGAKGIQLDGGRLLGTPLKADFQAKLRHYHRGFLKEAIA